MSVASHTEMCLPTLHILRSLFHLLDQRLLLLQLQLEAVAQEAATLRQGTPGWGGHL